MKRKEIRHRIEIDFFIVPPFVVRVELILAEITINGKLFDFGVVLPLD
jgi:hypothetical protein